MSTQTDPPPRGISRDQWDGGLDEQIDKWQVSSMPEVKHYFSMDVSYTVYTCTIHVGMEISKGGKDLSPLCAMLFKGGGGGGDIFQGVPKKKPCMYIHVYNLSGHTVHSIYISIGVHTQN